MTNKIKKILIANRGEIDKDRAQNGHCHSRGLF